MRCSKLLLLIGDILGPLLTHQKVIVSGGVKHAANSHNTTRRTILVGKFVVHKGYVLRLPKIEFSKFLKQ
jgi:hypothetical protein